MPPKRKQTKKKKNNLSPSKLRAPIPRGKGPIFNVDEELQRGHHRKTIDNLMKTMNTKQAQTNKIMTDRIRSSRNAFIVATGNNISPHSAVDIINMYNSQLIRRGQKVDRNQAVKFLKSKINAAEDKRIVLDGGTVITHRDFFNEDEFLQGTTGEFDSPLVLPPDPNSADSSPFDSPIPRMRSLSLEEVRGVQGGGDVQGSMNPLIQDGYKFAQEHEF